MSDEERSGVGPITVGFTRLYIDRTLRPPGIEIEAHAVFVNWALARRFIRQLEAGRPSVDLHGNMIFDYDPWLAQ
jgi:hypothetical protein